LDQKIEEGEYTIKNKKNDLRRVKKRRRKFFFASYYKYIDPK
jgi:hypothetical protein